MGSKQSTIDYILPKIQDAGEVSARKMFGEYGVYCDGRVVAMVCDDQFYLKPTEAGRKYLVNPEEGQPYPGAKLWFLIPEDEWDDKQKLTELLRVTVAELPLPKPKKK